MSSIVLQNNHQECAALNSYTETTSTFSTALKNLVWVWAMPDIKKFFTEGLIQVAILLSLVGIRVDVDPNLPPFSEIILGPSSALTQTQFHNLRNIFDGHNVHPKSIDLDGFFTARRLLGWVRSLDRLQVPAAEVEAWLVHREPDTGVSVSSQVGFLEESIGLQDAEEPLRIGNGDFSYVGIENQTLGALGLMPRSLQHEEDDDIFKEEDSGEPFIWEYEPLQNVPQEQFENERAQPDNMFSEGQVENEFMVDSWTNTNTFHNQMLQEDLQMSDVREETSLWPLVDSHLLLDEDPELTGPSVQNVLQRPLISPLLSEQESTFSLEQQWQDVFAIMESQVMDTDETPDGSNQNTIPLENLEDAQHQATPTRGTELLQTTTIEGTLRSNSHSNINSHTALNAGAFEDPDILDLLLTSDSNQSPFDPLLGESMLDEIGLVDLDLEQLSLGQLEGQNQADSDSGLSLNYSQSPTSPCGSESSTSSSSSCSTNSLSPEEGAVGYTHIKEDDDSEVDFMPNQSKMYQTSFLEAQHFHRLPWLKNVGHDHTYNQPQSQRKAPKDVFEEASNNMALEHLSSRDEKRARLMNIPFSNEHIINLQVEEFNRLLAKYHLSEAQLTLIRDIRRRGKNKMAAQNCRRRKLDVLVGLERNVNNLRRLRTRLLREKSEITCSIREMKQHLNNLYEEVYDRLREEQGILHSESLTLEQDRTDASSKRRSDSQSRRKVSKKQKHK
ncbi:hypothetical protein DNTS_001711 [Danionella cerebrum]|uniref:Endoplasmic reticulum membrane sensor NFE2L1 n=1 Tax=Danionella cerebrum TaxID=2873325 RepID=A0A553QJ91_9TELE|nr:hypothetical protein DNTS_001711 [Danionella translucida]